MPTELVGITQRGNNMNKATRRAAHAERMRAGRTKGSTMIAYKHTPQVGTGTEFATESAYKATRGKQVVIQSTDRRVRVL